MPRGPSLVAALLVMAVLLPTARADVFLLKSGDRITGTKDGEYKGGGGERWVRVATGFGTVSFPKASLRKHLKAKKVEGPVRVTQIVVTTLRGDVWKSGDGQAWERLSPRTNDSETYDELPVNAPNAVLAPGEALRTDDGAEADLDLGFALVHVAPSSRVTFPAADGPSLRLLEGAAGATVSERPRGATFTVETPQASLGVRGTSFVVRVDGDTTRLAVEAGKVEMDGLVVSAGGAAERVAGSPPVPTGHEDADGALFTRLRRTYAIPRLDWVHVPAGRFAMGLDPDESPDSRPDQVPRHDVDVPAFRMSKYEITNAQFEVWLSWMREHGDHAYCHPAEPKGTEHGLHAFKEFPWNEFDELVPRAPEQPVAGADWWSAYAFCAWVGARLPSEAEWEYCARAGTTSGIPNGSSQKELGKYEWIGWNSGRKPLDPKVEKPRLQAELEGLEAFRALARMQVANGNRAHPPGELLPNAFGIHDMLGNVAELCFDLYHRNYEGAPTDGSPWVRKENLSRWGTGRRVFRGQHFLTEFGNPLRPSWRAPIPNPVGFRPAMSLR